MHVVRQILPWKETPDIACLAGNAWSEGPEGIFPLGGKAVRPISRAKKYLETAQIFLNIFDTNNYRVGPRFKQILQAISGGQQKYGAREEQALASGSRCSSLSPYYVDIR